MNIQLANILAVTTSDAVRREKQREEAEYKTQLYQARVTAQSMIARLPDFLKSLATRQPGFNRAFIVGQYQYRPYSRVPFDRDKLWPPTRYTFSKAKIHRYLIGVPKYIALWGLSQGFMVQVSRAHGHPDYAFSWVPADYRRHDDSGIAFFW